MTFWEGEKNKKPEPGDNDQDRGGPEWEWFWDKASLAVMPNGLADHYDIVGKMNGVLTNAGAVADAVYSFGQAISLGGGSNRIEYSPKPTGQQQITLALVFVREAADLGSILSTSEPTNTGYRIFVDTDGTITTTLGGVANIHALSTVTVVGRAYFVAWSFDAAANRTTIVLKSLEGSDFETVDTTSTSNPITSDGTYSVGGSTIGSSDSPQGAVGMAAIVDRFMPLSALLNWSRDPFGPFRMSAESALAEVSAGFIPYPHPRYALSGGMQSMDGGV